MSVAICSSGIQTPGDRRCAGEIAVAKSRILLVDDHAVAEAFKKRLEPQFDVVATVSDSRSLLTVAPQVKPDVVVVGMQLLNGIDAGKELKALLPRIKLIVLTTSEDCDVAAEVLHKWASGYLLRKSAASELVTAILEVLKGNSYVTSRLAQKVCEEFIRSPRHNRTKTLTQRQREVLQLLAEGKAMNEVADILHIAMRTVAFHKYRIMEEFGLKTNSELVRFAIRQHISSL